MAARVSDLACNGTGGHVTTISIKMKGSDIDDNQNHSLPNEITPTNEDSQSHDPPVQTLNSTFVHSTDYKPSEIILGQSVDSLHSFSDNKLKGKTDSKGKAKWYCTFVKHSKRKSAFESGLLKYTDKDPDKAADCENLWTFKRDQAVKLRVCKRGKGSEEPLTVAAFLQRTVQRGPNILALAVKRNGEWIKWTYRQYYDDVCQAAKSFIKLGLQPYYSVGILGFNSPEWFIANLGTIFAGGLSTGIYTTNTPETCQFIANNAKSNIIVVENNQMLQKILQVKDKLPDLIAIIQYTGEVSNKLTDIYSWNEFMQLGVDVPDDILMTRLNAQSPNKCCTLIYTSGTTGDPKGVMLCHDNLTWTSKAASDEVKLVFGQEVMVSYLPLSHVAAQVLDLYLSISCGASVYFAQPDALKGSLGVTLKEVRPTAIFGVPRVWEKMMEKMIAVGQSNSGLKKKIAGWAKSIGLRGNHNIMQGQDYPFMWSFANALVFKKVRQALGFDRCRFFLSGAAPITKETLEYFLSLNIVIQEVYGMSESTGPHSFCRTGEGNRITSVGLCMPGVETKLANPDEDGNGEVCMYGRHVFMGYLDQEAKTKETFDSEGYLLTGDIGRQDQDGFLYITGRIKELIITAGGENIAPVPVEDAVKEALPPVSQCMLIGDKRKFLSMLITLKTEVNMDTQEPEDTLTKPTQQWCRYVGSNATTLSEIIRNQDVNVLKAIQKGIDMANSKSVSRAATIQKWSILPKDFSIPGGELGPTMKLRRPIVSKMYQKTINAFYAS